MELQKIFAAVFLGFFAVVFSSRNIRLGVRLLWRPLSTRFLRYVVYPRIFYKRRWRYLNPTRAELLLYVAHWATTITFNAYGIRSLSEASLRAAQIGTVHLLPLLAFRQLSFAADIFGFSLRSFYAIHRSVGIMATLQGIFHTAIALQGSKITAQDTIIGLLVRVAAMSVVGKTDKSTVS